MPTEVNLCKVQNVAQFRADKKYKKQGTYLYFIHHFFYSAKYLKVTSFSRRI